MLVQNCVLSSLQCLFRIILKESVNKEAFPEIHKIAMQILKSRESVHDEIFPEIDLLE